MHTVKLLLRLLRPQRRRVLLLLLVLVGATVTVMLFPALAGLLFKLLGREPLALPKRAEHFAFARDAVAWANRLILGPPGAPPAVQQHARLIGLAWLVSLGVVVAGLRSLFFYSRGYLGQYIGGRALIDLRTQLFAQLQGMSLAFYESQRVGDLMSRLTTDVSMVQQMFTEDMTNYFQSPVIVVAGIVAMFFANWRLTLLMMVFAPLTAYVVSRTGRRMRRLTRSQQERIGDLNARLHERLASMRIIQSFAQEQFEIDNFRRLNEDTFAAAIRVARVNALAPQIVQFLAALSFLVLVICAGVFIIGGRLTLAELVFYFATAQQVGVYFVRFGTLHLRVQQSLAALSRIWEVMGREPDVRESPTARPLPRVEGRISLRGVSFRYAEGEEVLRGIDLEIAPGEMVALVGPSGAGKTSLANLVMRFYDPTEGRVEIDGHDVREVTFHSLRSQIGLVPQETVLFGGTIRDNILYGKVGASEEEVVAAARAANAHDFISALAEGYGTQVGERGVKLSGGQRQRLAVARALLKDPRILILDEATSSLDAESEALVQEALERLMQGRTTLVIAHRLSTIRKANRILVLSGGQIAEQGSHRELLAQGGAYHRLYGMQQQMFDAPEVAPEA
jgi:ATP-binding cassette, subfamily B, bacterial MsbA